jgi:alkaline phosphatase D
MKRSHREHVGRTPAPASGVGRREFLSVAALGGCGLLGDRWIAPLAGRRMTDGARRAGHAPAIVTSERLRPQIPSGIQTGDVTADRAIVWSRTDRPARMMVEVATNDAFRDARRITGPAALDVSDFTAHLDVGDLPPGEQIVCRVTFESLAHPGAFSEPLVVRFRTAPAGRRDLRLLWSGDTVGQGWGINPDMGGLRLYETMAAVDPDLFVHSGDQIYADQPLSPEVTLDDGTTWRNVVTEAKSKVAETLADFRGNFAYNLLDEHARQFNAQVPMVVQWDDHEVIDNWFPGMTVENPRYTVRSADLLAARARHAMFDYLPIRRHPDEAQRVYRSYRYGPALEIFVLDLRSYRGPNTHNRQEEPGPETTMLGAEQLAWFKQALKRSTATWKLIASDMPLGLMVLDRMREGRRTYEAWANGEGPPLGRELELADILRCVHREDIRNLVWITADVHYAAAHHYSPDRAVFTDFRPFWEFVAGPMHAGTFGPPQLDPTFGPDVKFISVPPDMEPNRPPSEGLQFFGMVEIDGRTEAMTVAIHNLRGERLYKVGLEPERG